MKKILLTALLFAAASTALHAQNLDSLVKGKDVSQYFTFAEGETLKYENFEDKTVPTATFIWGKPSPADAQRKKFGGHPTGNMLVIIYDKGMGEDAFAQSVEKYSDGVQVEGVGANAVWSERRRQLSFITDAHLAVHISIEDARTKDRKSVALKIAADILKRLSE